MKILITGCAGFIGSCFAKYLLDKTNYKILGIDNLNDYYSIKLKNYRLKKLKKYKNFQFFKLDLRDRKFLKRISKDKIDVIFHLAAQPGVRYSVTDPKKYFDNNILTFFNIIELIKILKIKKFFYASSSSVYGDQKKYPLEEKNNLNEKNFYGFSKKINEIMAKFFSQKLKCKFIGLRFFTVFGEWGRPDMLIFKYLEANLKKKIFYLNYNGEHYRDFTYINDVTSVLHKLLNINFKNNFEIFNVCSQKPQKIINIIKSINIFNKKFKFKKNKNQSFNKIEVLKTHGNNKKLLKVLNGFNFTKFDIALNKTVNWYIKNFKEIFD